MVGEALAGWDLQVLGEGLRAYLGRHRKRVDRLAVPYAQRFLLWVRERGSPPYPAWDAEVVPAFLAELKAHGPQGGPAAPLSWHTVRRHWVAIRYLFAFLAWAGHPPPAHLHFPPFQAMYREGAPHLEEREWQALWRAAEAFMPAHWRPFLKVLLVLLGEVGLTMTEACTLWREDVVLRGEASRLRVRGSREREIPLSPLARKTLGEWLPLRDMLASRQALPHPHLLLNPAPRRWSGRPVDRIYADKLLQQLVQLAGIRDPQGGRMQVVQRLRWRAVRRLLDQGHPPKEVAYWVGMRFLGLSRLP